MSGSVTTKTKTFNWAALPDELKCAILKADTLSVRDVRAFSSVDSQTYLFCLPILFNTVNLANKEALDNFLAYVPSSYFPLIQQLDICTKPQQCDVDRVADQCDEITEKIEQILSRTSRLTQLSLCIGGSLRSSIIPVFGRLQRLHTFALANWADEEIAPLSERLAMALTFSLPALQDLSLTRITRSALYAPELIHGTVPVVNNDGDVPSVPGCSSELRLPLLLSLSHLRRLRIRETHLGDHLWGSVDTRTGAPQLEVLDLGASAYETPAYNDQCTQRILARAPLRSVHTFSLSTGSSTSPGTSSCPPSPSQSTSPTASFAPSQTEPCTAIASDAFPNLRTLHLTPLVSPDLFASTLSQPALANSPVHTLSCAFDPADAAEGCRAVETFLWERGMSPLSSSSLLPTAKRIQRTRSGSVAAMPSFAAASSQSSLKRRSTLSYGSLAYPSLQTLSISLSPPEPPATPASYSTKLTARIQARRAREAGERKEAARSLVRCCRTLGVHAEVHDIDIGVISEEAEVDTVDEMCAEHTAKLTLNGRGRSTTF